MTNTKSHKVSFIIILSIVFCVLCMNKTYAQKTAPNFITEIKWTTDSSSIDIKITVEKGIPPFSYKLYNKLPNEGGSLLSEETEISSFTFNISNLLPQNYILIVSDKTALRNARPIYIKK